MIDLGLSSARLAFVPNCVETSRIKTAALPKFLDLSSLGIQAPHRVVGIVANLRRDKNLLMFVKAMAEVLPVFTDVRGLIVGQPVCDQPDVPREIKSMIKELDLDGRITLAGFRAYVPALMHRMALLCLTSDYEGTPNVILEAMAAALPVVATRVGGVPELVRHGVTGFLVEPGDVEGLACKIRYLLSNPEQAKNMGLAGQRIVEREFGGDQAALRLWELYRDESVQKGILAAETGIAIRG
jgi:glycosyltransferase involved in cell wall biosynthesis